MSCLAHVSLVTMSSPVSCESNIKEGFAEASDDSGRPGPVSAKVHPDQDHRGRDLRAVRPTTLLPEMKLYHKMNKHFDAVVL